MGIKFSNNASANIIQALTSTATSVSVTEGKGDLFPSLTEGDYFYATLAGNNGLEIVKVTNRVKDTMTIVRAQDNTTALSFDTGDLFELRIVAADFNDTFYHVETTLEDTVSHVETTLKDTVSNVETTLEDTVDTLNSSVDNKMSSYLPLSGGLMTDEIKRNGTLARTTDPRGDIYVLAGEGYEHISGLFLRGYNSNHYPGYAQLMAGDSGKTALMNLSPSGRLTVNENDVLTSAGGTMKGNITFDTSDGKAFLGYVSPEQFRIGAGTLLYAADAGVLFDCYTKQHASTPGRLGITCNDGSKTSYFSFRSDGAFFNDKAVLTEAGGNLTGGLYGEGGILRGVTDKGNIWIGGGTNSSTSSFIQLNGGESKSLPGGITFMPANSNGRGTALVLAVDSLKYGGNNVLTSAGGVITGNTYFHKTLAWASGSNEAFFHDQDSRTQMWVNANGGFHIRPKETPANDFVISADGTPYSRGNRVLTGADVAVMAPGTTSFTLPSGGTWRYLCVRTEGDTNKAIAGQAAGGTTVNFGHQSAVVLCIRVA